jgi:hypothetical protein
MLTKYIKATAVIALAIFAPVRLTAGEGGPEVESVTACAESCKPKPQWICAFPWLEVPIRDYCDPASSVNC